jgi:hypothetical protein
MPTKPSARRARNTAASEATGPRPGAVSWRDDPAMADLEHRAVMQRRAMRERTEQHLRRLRRETYEPWQRGLIGAVDVYSRRREREAIAEESRRTALKRRQADAAVLRRAGSPRKPIAPALPIGAPKTAKNFIVGCAVSAWRSAEGRTTYREIAAFIVDSLVPHFVPPQWRAPLLRGKTSAEHKARLADQIRRAKSRQDVAS